MECQADISRIYAEDEEKRIDEVERELMKLLREKEEIRRQKAMGVFKEKIKSAYEKFDGQGILKSSM